MDGLLAGLNAAQKAAVVSDADVLQVLAPPGSGKTKTLTARVSYLITQRHYKPWNILVCTFTVKAAREMKERLKGVIGEDMAKKLILGTFHSVARRFLSTYGHYIGLQKQFGIADTSDTKAILKRIIKDHDLSMDPGKAQSRISSSKAKKISVEHFAATAKKNKAEDQEFLTVYSHYQEALDLSNLLDYDDLLLKCEHLLRHNPQCVSNIDTVLIDEFQDTNEVQFDLMCRFSQRNRRITIVGDPDQSIYGWRNAEIENLNKMKRYYPDTLVIFLEENYRSSGAILNSAQTVIEQDKARPAKRLQATHSYGERPVLRKLPTADAEARWLVAEVKRGQAMTGGLLTHNDFAILLRSAQLSRHIETALGNAGIPYRMVGGTKFYDRAEIKILLDYMRVADRPEHNDALLRVLNVPARNIGDVSAKKLLDEATAKHMPVWELILDHTQGRSRLRSKLPAQAEKGVAEFVNVILSGRKKLGDVLTPVSNPANTLLEYLLKKLEFEKFLKKKYPEDHESRWANVEELRQQTSELDQDPLQSAANDVEDEDEDGDEEALPLVDGAEQSAISVSERALTTFLSNIALSSATEQRDPSTASGADPNTSPAGCVTISTIHAAKGLEWPVVFLPAVYEGSIPHSRAEDTDEERRLLYVGMTRAQAILYLSLPLRCSGAASRDNGAETTLSTFLSADGVEATLARRGPELDGRLVARLAGVLGRDCPGPEQLARSRDAVDLWDDTYWPEDGSWPVEESERWDRGRLDSLARAAPWGGGVQGSPGFGSAAGFMKAAYATPASFAAAVASRPPGGAGGGFVSAASRMVELDALAEEAAARGKVEAAAAKAAAAKQRGLSKKADSGSKHGGDIAAFFGRPPEVRVEEDNQSMPLQPLAATAMNATMKRSWSGADDQAVSVDAAACNKRRQPLSQPGSFKRPPVHSALTTMETQDRRYGFLDSSPPRVKATVSSFASTAEISSTVEELDRRPSYKPASTFHTTSMASLRAAGGSANVKRSLGMKGPMKPWSARGTK